jgi:hypothetical protein
MQRSSRTNTCSSDSTKPPRPIHSYLHTASICHSDILPHIPLSTPDLCLLASYNIPNNKSSTRNPHYSTATRTNSVSSASSDRGIPSCGDDPAQSAAASFLGSPVASVAPCSEHALLRSAVDCFMHTTASSNTCSPSETCWFIQFPYQIESGLFLSHSATLASTACHLSTTLIFWLISLECSLISLIEDHRKEITSSIDCCSDATRSEATCLSGRVPEATGTKQGHGSHREAVDFASCERIAQSMVQKSNLAAFEAEDTALYRPLQLPWVPEQPPSVDSISPHCPKRDCALLKFSLTCGEGHRRAVGAAVSEILPSVLTRYRHVMPYSLWRRGYLTAVHGIRKQLATIHMREGNGCMHAADEQAPPSDTPPSIRCTYIIS